MIGTIIALCISVLLAFPFWTIVHEFSHILVAKIIFKNISPWSVTLYPHKHDGKFYWARCSYMMPINADSREIAAISIAPRIANGAFGIVFLIAGIFCIWPAVYVIGAAIDIFTGTLGISKESDLQRAARGLEKNIWTLRTLNIIMMVAFIAGAIAIVIRGLA